MFLFKSFFRRISTDFRQKELLPLKLLFFVHSSTLFVLYPYLTIHMRELGINVEETAIMSAVTPIVAIIMPPVAGLIADRIGNFKVILSLFSGLGGAASLLLLLVPVGRTTVIFPKQLTVHLACTQGNYSISFIDDDPCYKQANTTLDIPLNLESCGLTCQMPPSAPAPDEEYGRLLSGNRVFVPSEIGTCRDLTTLQVKAVYKGNPVKSLDVLTINHPFNNTCEEVMEDVSIPAGNETLELANCSSSWLATLNRPRICTNPSIIRDLDIRLTFWLYLIVRVFIGMIGGTAFAMFEGAVIAILREHKADYGLQRIYATIGGMISSPVSGWLIDYASFNKGYTDFRPAFYLYAGLKIVSALLMLTINLEFKSPATNVLSDVITVLRKVEIVGLLITCFILGTAWGYIESFLFWLLQDLGASRSLMGITITVGGIAGLPLLVMSGPIIDRIGHANVLFIGFIFYAIRLIGYSLIYNPWHCLIFEAMESVTSSLAFTAAVTYAAKLSTTTTDSSIQGLLGGLYFGVGKGSGSLIGGYLMKAVGTRPTYQIFAAVTLVTGCLYYLFNKFYVERIRPREKVKVEVNEKPISAGVVEKAEEAKGKNGGESLPMKKGQSESNSYQATNHVQGDGSATNPGFEAEEAAR